MTLPVWPTELPEYVLRDGFGAEGPNPNEETEMEDGQPYVRRRALTLWTPVTLKVFLRTPSQVTALKTFWRQTLNCGVKRFTMPVYTFDGPGYVDKTCLWSGKGPDYAPYAGPNQPAASFRIKVLDY